MYPQSPLISSRRKWILVFVLLLQAGMVHAGATITIVNNDGGGEGFNDPSPASPVGGNPGTTLGAQRLNAFQHAADIWGEILNSDVVVRVGAAIDPQFCNPTSAVLGSAGPTTAHRDFSGAGFANTWYGQALANSLAGTDLGPGTDDIGATFNSRLDDGDTDCLSGIPWYYGLDGNPPVNTIDFVTVVLHELGHGLNFLTFINGSDGTEFQGRPDIFEQFMEDHSTGKLLPDMNDTERLAAATDTGDLHFTGQNLVDAAADLTDGRHPGGHVELYAPNPIQIGSSLSHFSNEVAPNELMEPSFTEVLHDPGLSTPLFKDLGWSIAECGDGIVAPPLEQCDDGNTEDGDGCSSTCQFEPPPLDHYMSYRVRRAPRTARFNPFGPVTLTDQFRSTDYLVIKPSGIGVPASKNEEPILDPVIHLEEYRLKQAPQQARFSRQRNVNIINQCNNLDLEVLKPLSILVPTHKDLVSEPTAPVDPDVDHFLCYAARVQARDDQGERLPRFPRGTQVDVADQFQTRRYDLLKITKLCNPVDKTGNPVFLRKPNRGQPVPTFTPALRNHPDDHLVCYAARLAKRSIPQQSICGGANPPGNRGEPINPKQEKHERRAIFLNNQFGAEQQQTVKEVELCLPSAKFLP